MAEEHTKPHKEYTSSELLSSAKLVAEAAQSSLRNESDHKVDKAKVADAAGDLLDAATQYAKLDEQKGIGQYVEKGADYLHHYKGTTAPSKPSTTAPSESEPPKQESHGDAPPQSGGGGGFGQFTKLAGDFLSKKWFHHI